MPALPVAYASSALLLEQLIRSPAARRELRVSRMQFMVACVWEAFDRRCRLRFAEEEASGYELANVPRSTRELRLFDALNRRTRVLWRMRG